MPINKNAIIRYRTLDKCFRNRGRRFGINDLLIECNKAIHDFDASLEGIKKRQLYSDIKFMESEQGWSVPLEKVKDGVYVYYRYEDPDFTINSQSINAIEASEIKSALLVLSRFQGMPQFEWVDELIPKINQEFGFDKTNHKIISFQGNQYLEGTKFISPLFNAIQNKQSLEISYKSYKSEIEKVFVVSPWLLKQYNNRWFLFCKSEDYDTMTNLALDRIVKVQESSVDYTDTTVDFEEYFDDFIGVSKNEVMTLEKIVLRAESGTAPYIKSKPLHSSQRRISETAEYYEFSIEVIPNYELESLILSFGDKVKVIKPDSFANQMKSRIKNLSNLY